MKNRGEKRICKENHKTKKLGNYCLLNSGGIYKESKGNDFFIHKKRVDVVLFYFHKEKWNEDHGDCPVPVHDVKIREWMDTSNNS